MRYAHQRTAGFNDAAQRAVAAARGAKGVGSACGHGPHLLEQKSVAFSSLVVVSAGRRHGWT